MSAAYKELIHIALSDQRLQDAVYASTGRLIEHRRRVVARDVLPDFEELRTQANLLKRHTLDNLDFYLEEFEKNVVAHGGRVVYCKDGGEVAAFLAELAKSKKARLLVKSKSMLTEELDLNERLAEHHLETVETDLGEYIIQLRHDRPSHIVAPALHLTRYDVADVFTEHLHVERETVPENQTRIARQVLRQKFLAADIGISGANFLVADSGAVVVVENEGNARLSTSAPKVHVAIAGIEKLIPRAADLAVFLKLLGRSATGQPLTVYTSMLSGPRRTGEIDGPGEFIVVLVDNGRTRVLAEKEKRQSLYCIRCGACLNHCPVYRKVGGHTYPWVYSGPIGAVLTPQFHGFSEEGWLPFASSLCGACGEVCPVKIDLPRLLLRLRGEAVRSREKERDFETRVERLTFRIWAWLVVRPKLYELALAMAPWLFPANGDEGWLPDLPAWMKTGPLKQWISRRELPVPAAKSFRQLWRMRQSAGSR